jgi:hypothetical protein
VTNLGGPVTSAARSEPSEPCPARPTGRSPRTAAAAAHVRRTVELTTQNTENNCIPEVHALIALSHAALAIVGELRGISGESPQARDIQGRDDRPK